MDKPIGTELGYSLLDRPFVYPENGMVFLAVFRDADLQEHRSLPFAPVSGGEWLIWLTECRTLGRRLGHRQLDIYRCVPGETTGSKLIESWARFSTGDWMPRKSFEVLETLNHA